jgi:hypothetical protein
MRSDLKMTSELDPIEAIHICPEPLAREKSGQMQRKTDKSTFQLAEVKKAPDLAEDVRCHWQSS